MKKHYLFIYLFIYLFAAVALVFTACKDDTAKNEPVDPSNPTEDPSVNPSVDPGYDFKAYYDRAQPGIYTWNEESDGLNSPMHMLAKCTDGAVLYIDDTNPENFPYLESGGERIFPGNFEAWDGNKTFYSFWMEYYNDIDESWLTQTWKDTVFYKNVTYYNGDNEYYNLEITKQNFYIDFMFFNNYTKVADAGDLATTYVEMCRRVQTAGPIVPIADQVLCYEEVSPNHWLAEYYPQDMEAGFYVFPYTGEGKILSMKVKKVFDWGLKKNGLWLPRFVTTNDVNHVEVTISDANEEEVKAYIQKIKSEGYYTRVLVDGEMEGGFGIAFEADSWTYDESHSTEGYAGYVYPTYKVMYSRDSRLLKIEFEVAKVGFV